MHLRSALARDGDAAIVTVGVDRCAPLIDDAKHNVSGSAPSASNEVAVGDALQSNLRTAAFDYALSIATIHHFSTPERRMRAVQELIRVVQPVAPAPPSASPMGEGAGRLLIFVWAYEQRGGGRRQFDAVLDATTQAQDVLVPWVMTPQHTAFAQETGTEQVHQRCTSVYLPDYHVFREGELDHLVEWAAHDLQQQAAASSPHAHIRLPKIASGWDKGNWWGVWRVERTS